MKSYSHVIQLPLMLGLPSGRAAAQDPSEALGIDSFEATLANPGGELKSPSLKQIMESLRGGK